jgi:hypothetical protein
MTLRYDLARQIFGNWASYEVVEILFLATFTI